jgi:phosphoribosylanthranilate isomerase
MSILVKICGLTDGDAVQAAVDAGADAVGFVFYDKSPRNISPEKAASLAAHVPGNVLRIAVMLHPDATLWDEVSDALRPDVVQTDIGDFSYLRVAEGITKWPVLREGSVSEQEKLPATFVYEGTKSGHGQTVDWGSAAAIARRGQMILAGGLTIDNVADAIVRVAPYGVDVSSAVESQPGKKDVELIAAFVTVAKAAAITMGERCPS